ncbi:hypothetical protein ACFE04_014072 [Oxalis oulophora]
MPISPFQVFVKTPSNGTVTAFVRPEDTIEELKKQVFRKLSIPQICHSYFFFGRQLRKNHDFAYYNVQRNSTINMVIGSPSVILSEWEIERFKIVSGKYYTVGEYKQLMRKKNIRIVDIIVDGIVLHDDFTFAGNGVTKQSKLWFRYEVGSKRFHSQNRIVPEYQTAKQAEGYNLQVSSSAASAAEKDQMKFDEQKFRISLISGY